MDSEGAECKRDKPTKHELVKQDSNESLEEKFMNMEIKFEPTEAKENKNEQLQNQYKLINGVYKYAMSRYDRGTNGMEDYCGPPPSFLGYAPIRNLVFVHPPQLSPHPLTRRLVKNERTKRISTNFWNSEARTPY